MFQLLHVVYSAVSVANTLVMLSRSVDSIQRRYRQRSANMLTDKPTPHLGAKSLRRPEVIMSEAKKLNTDQCVKRLIGTVLQAEAYRGITSTLHRSDDHQQERWINADFTCYRVAYSLLRDRSCVCTEVEVWRCIRRTT